MYFFCVDERYPNIMKDGSTSNIINRLRVYNTGRINDIELKYFAIVKNRKVIEKCVKKKLKFVQVKNNRELYKIEPSELKKVIDECYIKNVTDKEHAAMCEDVAEILGMYSYVNNKVNIKPYVIIGNDL